MTRWFRISFAEKAFLRVLGNHGWTVDSLSVDNGVAAMLEFYRDHRAQHTDLAEDGDGLLVQWSPGQLDVTRQLIRSGSPDNPIRQLSLTFGIEVDDAGSGTDWHFDPAAEIVVPAFFAGTPTSVTLHYDEV